MLEFGRGATPSSTKEQSNTQRQNVSGQTSIQQEQMPLGNSREASYGYEPPFGLDNNQAPSIELNTFSLESVSEHEHSAGGPIGQSTGQALSQPKVAPGLMQQDFVRQNAGRFDMARGSNHVRSEPSSRGPSSRGPSSREPSSRGEPSREMARNERPAPSRPVPLQTNFEIGLPGQSVVVEQEPPAARSSFKRFFGGWLGQDMAMDLGTANTLVYVKGRGIVLNEPSVVAIEEDTDRVVAVGRAAKDMYGKTSRKIRCIRPVKDGVIADFDITHLMIKEFITRVTTKWQLRRPRLIISVPSGITMVEKRAVIDAALSSGARQIHLVEEPMAAAIGSGILVNEVGGSMIVDIGGGTTEVAVISLGATAYSESVRIAGDEMDEAIELFIRRAFNLQIGIFEAERVKLAIGSAMPMAEPREMKIYGRDLATGVPRDLIVDDATIRRALKEPVLAIIDAVMRALERTSPELAEDIIHKGIFLAGGGALLAGLPERLSLETGLKFIRSANPLTAIVRGTGRVLDEFKDYRHVCIA